MEFSILLEERRSIRDYAENVAISKETVEKMISDASANYTVEYNSQAVSEYSPAKINMNIG